MGDFLQESDRNSGLLRELIAAKQMIVAPGAYDALTARIFEQAGFPAVYMTGFGTTASLIGRPDVGLLTMTEMADNARRISQAIRVPLIADADTGYGNPLNVIRTVREYERAGVSAIHIEDQITPKKCGHMEDKQLVSAAEMVEKVRAAIGARASPDFLIIARTDARAVEGLDSALRRANMYREAGADVLFVEAPQSEQEVALVARELAGTPLLFNFAEGGKTPPVGLARLRELGYRIVIFPIAALLAATTAVRRVAAHIQAHGTPASLLPEFISFAEFNQMIGLSEIQRLERQFAAKVEKD